METTEWFAIVANQDILDDNGKLEYNSGDVVSYGSVITNDAELASKGLSKVSIGLRNAPPDFSTEIWDATIPGIRAMTSTELAAQTGGG